MKAESLLTHQKIMIMCKKIKVLKDDHTLCYGHPWHPICQGCARNITDKVKSIDDSVFVILSSAPLNLKTKVCKNFCKKMFSQKQRR